LIGNGVEPANLQLPLLFFVVRCKTFRARLSHLLPSLPSRTQHLCIAVCQR
jgi:hypothetical protein